MEDESRSSGEIARDIRRTRAQMSETVDAIERRLSPERLKHEVKGTVQETIDEVRHRYNPQRMANRAGQNMMETMKDHPLPALAASLSIGYLLMKAGERNARRDYDYDRGDYDRRSRAYRSSDYGTDYYSRGGYREAGYHRAYPDYGSYPESVPYGETADDYRGSRPYYDESVRSGRAERYEHDGSDEERSARDRAAGAADDVRERTGEMAREARERTSEMADYAQERAQRIGREARHQAHRARSGLEQFIHDSPLAAGAIAAGVGALIGGLLPSTEQEDEWMGPARDEVVHRAEHVARETMERGKEAARRVADEARDAGEDVKETAREAGRDVKETALAEAEDVKDTARESARAESRGARESERGETQSIRNGSGRPSSTS